MSLVSTSAGSMNVMNDLPLSLIGSFLAGDQPSCFIWLSRLSVKICDISFRRSTVGGDKLTAMMRRLRASPSFVEPMLTPFVASLVLVALSSPPTPVLGLAPSSSISNKPE